MKFIIYLLFIFPFWVQAKPLYEKLEAKKYYFSALTSFLRETEQKKVTDEHLEDLEELIVKTGVDVLADYKASTLNRYETPVAYFTLARKQFQDNNFSEALRFSGLVPKGHWLYPEAQMIQARVFQQQKKTKKQLDAYAACSASASSLISDETSHYYRMLMEICAANHAREFFKHNHLKTALGEFNRFPKDTYQWPYLLFERAWLYYHLGDYNRSLGLLVTYKAPLLDTYFLPEAEYLSALNYFRLCLWQDSSLIINNYYRDYRPRYLALEKVLRENKDKKNFFFMMLFKRDQELQEYEEFVRQIVIRMKKQYRFSSGFSQIKQLNSEIKRLTKRESSQVRKLFVPHLKAIRSNLITKLDNYAKLEMFSFLGSVRFFSNELFKMNLEIMSRKKDLIYDNKKLIATRSRGDYSNVQRSRFEHFWKFEGAFWADELGDYSFGLKSNCKIVSKKDQK